MVFCLIFKSLRHFEFIFVYGVMGCSNFIDLHAAVQLSQHQLQKRLSFLYCVFLPPLLKINCCRCVDLFPGSLFCSIDLYVCFCVSIMLFFVFVFVFLIYYLFIIFIFGCVGSSFLCEGFLQLRRVGATLHHGARASHYCGLSCCGAEAPDAQAQ